MKLLYDENLSVWLVPNLADLYPGSVHVRDIGLKGEPDRNIWTYAKNNGLAIVTKDSDFVERSVFDPESPKVIWIRPDTCWETAPRGGSRRYYGRSTKPLFST